MGGVLVAYEPLTGSRGGDFLLLYHSGCSEVKSHRSKASNAL